MTTSVLGTDFCRQFDLTAARTCGSPKEPAGHQCRALADLAKWYTAKPFPNAGGILVLPTGGGKTFTAIRFSCVGPISDGYKVLWLAHTHHLLEQAFFAFSDGLAQIAEPKATLVARVVSGTEGHYRPVHIKAEDDVVIGTLQTINQAYQNRHPQLEKFLQSAKKKLLVVFDEAHHSPAPSYRNLVLSLRQRFPEMYLLGLTATPTYSDEAKRGWLKKLFPQGLIHQVTPQQLMAAGILARPISEEPRTNFTPQFDEREYKKWVGTHRDLPEEIISELANNRERNSFIAKWYADNKDKYKKTIMFADRWYQCEQLSEFLRARGVKAGTVYSHVDADPGSAAARNKRDRDENAKVLEAFRKGKIDVLINVRMLTEGTDVPDVQSVFLTRATTSQILLTQMIGRALRGPKFGGTADAYIVSFIDNWKQFINWAEYDQLAEGLADEKVSEYGKRPPIQLISIELVQRLARQMQTGVNMTPGPFVTLLPVGWYRVEYQTQVADSDNLEPVRELIMVFGNERDNYEKFIQTISKGSLEAFEKEDLTLDTVQPTIEAWQEEFFPNTEDRFGTNLAADLFKIARHIAQNGSAPRFFEFDQRDQHNLDAVAKEFIEKDLGARVVQDALMQEFKKVDRLWSTIYPRYDLFKSQYDACVNFHLHAELHKTTPEDHQPNLIALSEQSTVQDREPSEDVKEQVKERDGRCLCCSWDAKRALQVDHIAAYYYSGNSQMDNLQTLCVDCNRIKNTQTINFRNSKTDLIQPPKSVPDLKLPSGQKAGDLRQFVRYLRRWINFFYHCGAVHNIDWAAKGDRFYHWTIELAEGNDPDWLKPHLENLLFQIRQERSNAGYGMPKSLTVVAPGKKDVKVLIRREKNP